MEYWVYDGVAEATDGDDLMLVDIASVFGNLNEVNERQKEFFLSLSCGEQESLIPVKISTGVYISALNASHFIKEKVEDYPQLNQKEEGSPKKSSGVCDIPEDVLANLNYNKILHDPERRFTIFFTPIIRSCQERVGGWRWHKWGPYLGKQEPTMEYLYDEPNIEMVYVFHIVEHLKND